MNSCAVNAYLYGAIDCVILAFHILIKSKSTLCNFLKVKELLEWNRCDIWKLSGCNEIQTHNHLVRKWTLKPLGKLVTWLICVVSTYPAGVAGD